MRTRVSPHIISLARFLRKFKILKPILGPFYRLYSKRMENNRRNAFLKNGLSVLSDFDRAMSDNNIPYIVIFGTLLGAVREQGFIKHDLDIDVAIFNDDYSPRIAEILLAVGFKKFHTMEVVGENKGREESYIKDDVNIDIFYICSDDVAPTYACDFRGEDGTDSMADSMKRCGYILARRLEIPISKEIVRLQFESIQVNAPANYDQFLRCRYGDDYMIPNPQFGVLDNNSRVYVWDGVKATYISYH